MERQIRARGVSDPRVLEAMAQVPRHRFVGELNRHAAYEDTPLPIGDGQTISQPFIVAKMLEMLELRGDETVLELGAGSGYQTALLSLLARRVVALERVGNLARKARQALETMDIRNAVVLCADGTLGWSEAAPYQGIIVAAAAPSIPEPLLDQLDDGGRLVIPVGTRDVQDLRMIRRDGDELHEQGGGGCRFVPLLGRYGWEEKP